MSNTFCPLPWNSINLRNNGDVRICCNTNSYTKNRGILRKENDSPYNIANDDIDEIRNAKLLKEVRKTMLSGEWHPECERCRQEEVSGIQSRREYEVADWDLNVKNVIAYTNIDGTIDVSKKDLDYVDIRYGNFCNLKCRMCGPTDSHQWYDDFVKLYNKTSYKDTHDLIELRQNEKGRWTTEKYDWFHNSDHYWDQFERHISKAKKLYIVGGEPLIIPEHEESLQRLVDMGRAPEIQIEYNTNLTNVTSKMLSLWENFEQIRIGASIDGIGGVFDYQRAPAKWDHVYKNLLKLDQNKNINLKCWFAYTITPYNVFHLPEFMKWKLTESKLERFNALDCPRPVISQHMCHSPKYYNIKVLPHVIKEDIIDHFEIYRHWIQSTDFSDHVKTKFIEILDGTIQFMISEDYSEHLNTFIDYTRKLDEFRNQDITEVVPELAELFYD